VARPERFELPTPRFVVCAPFEIIDVRSNKPQTSRMYATIQTANRGSSGLDRPSAFRHYINHAAGYADPVQMSAKRQLKSSGRQL
jgi:hypothetical protein